MNANTHISKCIVYVFDKNNETFGLGVSVSHGEILVHKKFVEGSWKSMVKFTYNDYQGTAWLMGTYQSVASLKIINFKK